jgi:hypothetical protein
VKTWKSIWLSRIAVLAMVLAVAAACDDSLSPEDADPVGTAQVMDDVVANFFDDNEAVQGLEFFSEGMLAALGAGAPTAGAMIDMLPSDGTLAATRRAQAMVAELSDGGMQNLPVGVLGTTFVWGGEGYVPDFERTDAPEDGVRFIIYAVDPILFQPVEPLTEVGYVDIRDTSNFPTISIQLIAVLVEGTVEDTLINISSSATFNQVTETAILDFGGFISDGTNQLTFSLDATVSDTSIDLTWSMSAAGLTVSFALTGLDEAGGDVTTTFTDGEGNSIVVTLSVDGQDNILAGSGIAFNGTTVAIISGTMENPSITNGDGDPLTEQEMVALAGLFEAMMDVFDFFMGMFEFGMALLALALV